MGKQAEETPPEQIEPWIGTVSGVSPHEDANDDKGEGDGCTGSGDVEPQRNGQIVAFAKAVGVGGGRRKRNRGDAEDPAHQGYSCQWAHTVTPPFCRII